MAETIVQTAGGDVKHWHGAAPDLWFSHLAIEIEGEDSSTEWCEAVLEDDYNKLK